MKEYNGDFELNLKDILTTDFFDTCTHDGQKIKASSLVKEVKTLTEHYRSSRMDKEERWLECWAAYFGTPAANQFTREMAHTVVGEAQTSWRHRITTGKAYEIVETINAYLQGAFFPQSDWFDMQPVFAIGSPEYKKLLKVLVKYLKKKLADCNFEDMWDLFTRQMIVTGSSVIALPWRYDVRHVKKNILVTDLTSQRVEQVMTEKVMYNGLDLEVLDMFDTYLDPDAKTPNSANLIRRYTKSKAELIRLTDQNVYRLGKREHIKRLKPFGMTVDTHRVDLEMFQGFQQSTWHPSDKVEVLEFWGNICVNEVELNDVVVTVADDCILNVETNPFWGGKPFIVGTYTPILNSPYGIGALEPCLGNIHVQNLTVNQRLDSREITLSPMWEVMNDGVIDPNEVFSEPGKVFQVAQAGSIRPIARDTNMGGSVEEEQLQEQRIDKSTGLGAYLGVNSGRSGERVTAEEVIAQREAGGNRLNRVHKHMEATSLMEFLTRCYAFMQQFVVGDDIVRIRSEEIEDAYEYIAVGVNELSYDMDIKPLGADHIADKEFELRQRLDFISLVSGVPDMAQLVNWDELLKDLAQRFLRDDTERFVKSEAPAPPMPAAPPAPNPLMPNPTAGLPGLPAGLPPDAMAQIAQELKFTGGQPLVNAAQAAMTLDPQAAIMQKAQDLGVATSG